MSKPLRTSDLARALGIHPNTVRLYEAWGFLPSIPRSPAGYRLFRLEHLELLRLARTALHHPYPGGKEPALAVVRRAVGGDLPGALRQAELYLAQIRAERRRAEEAAETLQRWARGGAPADAIDLEPATAAPLRISAAAATLGITTDALRNWERNGLIRIPRAPGSGYRLYGPPEIARLRVIRLLRAAGYSMMAILRMVRRLDQGQTEGLREALDSPGPGEEDPHYITDRWLTTLAAQEERAREIIRQLSVMLRSPSARAPCLQPSNSPPRLGPGGILGSPGRAEGG